MMFDVNVLSRYQHAYWSYTLLIPKEKNCKPDLQESNVVFFIVIYEHRFIVGLQHNKQIEATNNTRLLYTISRQKNIISTEIHCHQLQF